MSVVVFRELYLDIRFWRHRNPPPVGLAAVQINHLYFEPISIKVDGSDV
jgi:hypothetical protein